MSRQVADRGGAAGEGSPDRHCWHHLQGECARPDLRNSRVPELREFSIAAMVTDPLADPTKAEREYGIKLVPREAFSDWTD
jgi:hypothetical protein